MVPLLLRFLGSLSFCSPSNSLRTGGRQMSPEFPAFSSWSFSWFEGRSRILPAMYLKLFPNWASIRLIGIFFDLVSVILRECIFSRATRKESSPVLLWCNLDQSCDSILCCVMFCSVVSYIDEWDWPMGLEGKNRSGEASNDDLRNVGWLL